MLFKSLNKFNVLNGVKFIIGFVVCFILCADFAKADTSDELLLNAARSYTAVLRSNKVDRSLLKNAKAIIIFPSIKKVGFVIGGLGGDGVMVTLDDGALIDTSVVSIGGGGAGLQAGYSDSAVVLFLMRQSLVEDIRGLKLVLKADMIATFATASASKNGVYGDIYAVSKDSGFYAGASLDAAIISYAKGVQKSDDYGYTQLVYAINSENLN